MAIKSVKLIKDLPKIKVFYNNGEVAEIDSLQYFDEMQDELRLQFVECNPIFKRGLVCDIQYEFETIDHQSGGTNGVYTGILHNLVLVYVNKNIGIAEVPTFEYVFYK